MFGRCRKTQISCFFPCPRKKGKNASDIWLHYPMKLKGNGTHSDNLVENLKDLDTEYVYCKHCRKRYRNHQATTTMRWHLDNEHRHINYKNDTSVDQQKKITSFVSTTTTSVKKMSQEKAGRVNDKLICLLINKMLLLSTVEHPSFIEFASELDSTYKVYGRKLVIKKMKEKYQRGQKTLVKLVADCPSVSLTHDSWTSIRTETFVTVTAHFIDDEWELHSAMLRISHFNSANAGVNIGKHLTETLQVSKIKDPTFVADNAANAKGY